jgi:hypothetical protein
MNYYPLISKKIESNPALVDEALETLDRWRQLGNMPPRRAAQWETILQDARRGKRGLRRLLALLRDNSERAVRIKDFGPFAGILTTKERRKVFLKCVFSH